VVGGEGQDSGVRIQEAEDSGQVANSLCLHLLSVTCVAPQAGDEILLGLRLGAALLDSSHSWLCAYHLATVETHCIVER
jgi:hypothetical protein